MKKHSAISKQLEERINTAQKLLDNAACRLAELDAGGDLSNACTLQAMLLRDAINDTIQAVNSKTRAAK